MGIRHTIEKIKIGADSFSWSSYWSSLTDKVLFFAETKDIADGKLYNKVTGSSDYLTVTGAAGSYAFECPNTAPYIAADTDYIWFKTNEDQRTPTEVELVGYDLPRTPIKYDDTTPYSIRLIMTLKAGVTLTATERDNLFKSFELPILWDDDLNIYGHVKGNRIGYTPWTPESVYPAVLEDGNTVGWYLYDDLDNITKDGSERISSWKDFLASGHDLIQATAEKQPTLTVNGVLFDGVDDFLRCVGFAFEQPEMIYLVFRQVTWANSEYILDGNALNSGLVQQSTTSPKIKAYAGGFSALNDNLVLNTFGILRILFDGVSSTLQINETAVDAGNFGTADMAGFTLGTQGNMTQNFSNIEVKEVILRKIGDTAPSQAEIYAYLKDRHSIV